MTLNISILNDYHEFDLDDRFICEKIADKIITNNANEIVLDTSNCLLGYDATCKVVDKIIDDLLAVSGNTKLTIISDYQFPDELIISFLFRGSKYISGEFIDSYNSIQEKLKESLSGRNIEISVNLNGQIRRLV